METPAGSVPRVRTDLSLRDIRQTIIVRSGIGRFTYRVTPGLYCVGNPTAESPVLVTANYKLTFDMVRKELGGLDAWLLIADTRGINVWCAAGKGLFSTDEIVTSVAESRLAEIVSHRTLILPQLGAPGVAAHKVRKACGFKVVYGPVEARDLAEFIGAGNVATDAMRSVTFTLRQRFELIPVELVLLGKPLLILLAAAFLLSGIGPDIFSLKAALSRGLAAGVTAVAGVLTGCVLVPLMLPMLPWRQFSPKGALLGAVAGLLCALRFASGFGEGVALTLLAGTVSSYLAMNFTGSTPFTSPTGVEKEMRRWLPYQIGATALAVIIWLATPFVG